jgi:glycosyltransferase involved in cell wall biosynthesis
MKILFVNNFRKRGGGEEFLRELLPGLAAKGITVGLICRPGTPLVDMFRDSSVRVYPIDRSGKRALTSSFAVSAIIRREGYGLVDIQRGHDIVQAWLGALFSGRKPVLVYTPQVPEFIRSRFLLRRMHAIVTISRYIRDRLTTFDPSLAPRTSIIYYGIDLDKFKPFPSRTGWLRSRFSLPQDARIIGTVGDLWKNQIEFLDALVEVRRALPGTRFALVAEDTGSPPVRAFKERAAALGLTDAVIWAGRLSKDDMLAFYGDIDIAVSTHRNEGFGIWALEAMAMGLPVVVYNAGGIRDAVEGCPAGVFVDGGPREMADAVIRLLEHAGTDRSLSGAASRWVRERFDRQRMIDDYERYFRTLVAGRR